MSSIPALNNAQLGIQRGLHGLRENAATIASADMLRHDSQTGSAADLATPMVEMIDNQLQVEASAKVMRAVDETLGTLIDIKA